MNDEKKINYVFAERFLKNVADYSCENEELEGYTSIDDNAAELFAKWDSDILYLNCLTELSDKSAKILSSAIARSEIHLNGLVELSEAAAGSLSKSGGYLSLKGLTELSEGAAQSLAKVNPENLILPDKLEQQVAEYRDGDYFIEQKILAKGVASTWLACRDDEESVDFSSFTGIEEEAADVLSKHKGELNLNGLTELSDAVAESLSKFEGDYLQLDGLTELSDAAAESLSKFKGEVLGLDGLTQLSDSGAEILSKRKGGLSLDGLTKLSDAAAESLSKCKEGLWLNGLTELSDAVANSLAKMNPQKLDLSEAAEEKVT